MESKNKTSGHHNGSKANVPHIKISAAKKDSNSKVKDDPRSKPQSHSSSSSRVSSSSQSHQGHGNQLETLKVANSNPRSRNSNSLDRRKEPRYKDEVQHIKNNVNHHVQDKNVERKKDSKESNDSYKVKNDKNKQKQNSDKPPPPGKIPMRRCASIDVGELNRKKKGKRSKKKKQIEESLIAVHEAIQKNERANKEPQRSGSLGARPTTLNLSNANILANEKSAFPTPIPTKRHAASPKPVHSDRNQSVNLNSISPDVTPNDTSAILPPKTKQTKPKSKKITESVSIDFSDPEDNWYDTFPVAEGYRKHGVKYNFPSCPYDRLQNPVIQKSWCRIIGLMIYSIFAFLVFIPVLALLCVIFPICYLVKLFLKCCCSCCCVQSQIEDQGCCACGQRLSLTEKFWIRNEVYAPQVVQSLVILEYGLSVPQIVNLINNRIVLAKKEETGTRLYPRFTQKVVRSCSDYMWKDDTNFFIHNHVFSMAKGIESLEDLQDYISDLASRPLTFTQPLWEVQVLTDFGDVRDTVVLFRMHPCLTDGVSMVKILYKSLADVDSVTTISPCLGKESCLDSFRSIFDGPIKFVTKLLSRKGDFNLFHGQHIRLSGKKVITWSEPYSLSSAMKIKQVTRSTLNEVFMSVAAGSLRNYLILNGVRNPYDIQSSVPVYYGANKHVNGQGNDVMLMNVSLPSNTEGVVPRLWQMKERMSKVRSSALFSVSKRLFKLSHHILTESVWNKLWIYLLEKCTCIVSSLPGPEVDLRISSKRIRAVFYWFPPVQKMALTISFFTYGDQIQMAVSADRNVCPNPELIANDFIFQMDSLYEQLGHRRIPGESNSYNKKVDLTLLNTEIRPEETAAQLQKKMSMIHQELQNLKHKLDAKRYDHSDEDHKLMKKIETLKEQFREMLVEMRKRKAAETELAMSFNDDDMADDDDEFDLPRRPFRRRAMSVSSRLSTSSVSSTVRPLPAPSPMMTPDYSPDSPLLADRQIPYTSYPNEERKFHTVPYASRRPSGTRQAMEAFEIIEYQYSPSMERRFKPSK